MTQEFRSCKSKNCGRAFPVPAKNGRGAPQTLCPQCKVDNKKANARKGDAKKNALAYAIHQHITKRYHKGFPAKWRIECQSFLSALFEEITTKPSSVPVAFRRALTNYVEAKGQNADLFAAHFGAFCRQKRGLKPRWIFKKNNITEEQRMEWQALEKAARARDEDIKNYIPFDGSCIQWLMKGFQFGNDSIIDEEDRGNDDLGNDEGNKDFELIPFERKTPKEKPPKSVKDVVYEYIIENENRGTTGRVTIIPLMVKLRGFDRNEVEQALFELQTDGLIMLDEFSNQYRTIKRAA